MTYLKQLLTALICVFAVNGTALEIIVARHGETTWNSEGRYQGHTDIPLSQTGREQARELGNALADLHFDAIYASDLSRAHETAHRIAESRRLAVEQDPVWREVCFGRFEGQLRADIDIEELLGLLRMPGLVGKDGVETLEAFHLRLGNAFRALCSRHAGDERVLLVAHGGVLRSLLEHSVDNSIGLPIRYGNCGYVVIQAEGDSARAVRCHNPLS